MQKFKKKHKPSSQLWLNRHFNDEYVELAKKEGFRSRAAFKLLEINEKYKVFRQGQTILDLGAAPGGWSQVALRETKNQARIIAVDILPILPIKGVVSLELDLFKDESIKHIIEHFRQEGEVEGLADVVMSDVAANTTGHSRTDHLRTTVLCEMAYEVAKYTLKEGGCFISKIFQGGTEKDLLDDMKQRFSKISHFKPKASRKESRESYLIATGFRH